MQLTNRQKYGIIAISVAGLVVLVMIFLYLMTHPVITNRLRDISIIVLAITLIVLDIVLMVMMWQIIKLLMFLLDELKPVLESLQETSSTVRGTASFVSEGVTSPMIDVSAKTAGAKGSLRYVLGSMGIRSKKQGAVPAAGPVPGWSAAATEPASGASEQTQEATNNVEQEGI
ncbi:MAG: hypothetical protein H6649_04250 [Caldilineae bacterium]|nr:hypothetical protein [Anaerolineae bacterium]MCB0205305.1 hypothetical protein [Anaerolineae bacterium]MCB0254625.1 hypothetical protein [Anaerolineae bacterium]MCB9153251.1 hypothetical protein [Caldilineae bacterium]